MNDSLPHMPPLADQGLELIRCAACGSLYYDLHRPNRWALYCVYCGHRLK